MLPAHYLLQDTTIAGLSHIQEASCLCQQALLFTGPGTKQVRHTHTAWEEGVSSKSSGVGAYTFSTLPSFVREEECCTAINARGLCLLQCQLFCICRHTLVTTTIAVHSSSSRSSSTSSPSSSSTSSYYCSCFFTARADSRAVSCITATCCTCHGVSASGVRSARFLWCPL